MRHNKDVKREVSKSNVEKLLPKQGLNKFFMKSANPSEATKNFILKNLLNFTPPKPQYPLFPPLNALKFMRPVQNVMGCDTLATTLLPI